MGSTHILSIPDAGREYFGLGRGASYAAAKRGEIPVLRIGRKLVVPKLAIERMLADASPRKPALETTGEHA